VQTKINRQSFQFDLFPFLLSKSNSEICHKDTKTLKPWAMFFSEEFSTIRSFLPFYLKKGQIKKAWNHSSPLCLGACLSKRPAQAGLSGQAAAISLEG